MCDGINRGSLIIFPWITGWPRIQEVTGYSRNRIQSLMRYEHFPLRHGPSHEVRIHPAEAMKWILPEEQWEAAERKKNEIGIPYKDSPLLGIERIFLTGWQEISWYLGYKSHVTAQRFFKDYQLPVFFKARRVRALPSLIDAFFIAWDTIVKRQRREFYNKGRKQQAGG